jgi:hypothetical protein
MTYISVSLLLLAVYSAVWWHFNKGFRLPRYLDDLGWDEGPIMFVSIVSWIFSLAAVVIMSFGWPKYGEILPVALVTMVFLGGAVGIFVAVSKGMNRIEAKVRATIKRLRELDKE